MLAKRACPAGSGFRAKRPSQFFGGYYRYHAEFGGWPRLNSEKCLWVPHPCGFQGAGFDFAFEELETDGKW